MPRPLVRRRLIRTARVGQLGESGFDVMPTFKNRYHYSIVLPDATAQTFAHLRKCFGAPFLNPGFTAVQPTQMEVR